MLVLADLIGLTAAFLGTAAIWGDRGPHDHVTTAAELLVFFGALPAWVLVAKLHGLYDRDEERPDHSTVDDLVGVFQVATVGVWMLLVATSVTVLPDPNLGKLATLWGLVFAAVAAGRSCARAVCRRSPRYVQNTIVVGAGDIGQLVARKLSKHPEYGLRVVGFVDADPKERRNDLDDLVLLGEPEDLRSLIVRHSVERVVVAFSNEPATAMVDLVRELADVEVQVDVVPRLFDVVGPNATVHRVEGLPLVGLPPVRMSPSSRFLKRLFDIVVSGTALALLSPVLAFIALRIRLDSPGPVFFRQTRLGLNMREFTALKFRTMKVDTDQEEHRRYIRELAEAGVGTSANGLFKLDRSDAVTRSGSWLRKTSLDELPQLLNVFRGEMSLVGPRPCIPYETETFARHHFERFLVPAGITGLWQVTARANSTFAEALEMDVAYARGWSLGLDVRLLLRTPFQLLRQRAATA
jgi:exopolysaccharide biosynthesis polyprenyl glycosylphosphotransferase